MSSKVQFKKRPTTDMLVIHCAATRPSMDIGVREIRQWHKGQGWFDVGYHYIIKRDGTVEEGRADDQIGSHAKGHNLNSVSICLVGGCDEDMKPKADYTFRQWSALHDTTMMLMQKFPTITKVVGHTDLDPKKACPSFDVNTWFTTGIHP